MECFKIENLSFTYPKRDNKTLDRINITINSGEFITLIGKSGSGKTTLLRLLKPSLAPFGDINGCISFFGKDVSSLSKGEEASKIGFVMQKPDNQIVCDKVWHELAFLGESLGLSQGEIRMRVAEMASFFGIENWFYNKVSDLSGGQKQLLNLASVMVMQPEVLILDEPSSQLDPISAREFLKAVERINRELGTTIILTEHRLSEAFPISDRVIVIDKGKIIADEKPKKVAQILKNENHSMYCALPIPTLVANSVCDGEETPLTIREGREWLENYIKINGATDYVPKREIRELKEEYAVEIKDAFFRYEKDSPDIIKGLNLKVKKGEFYAVLGGNGTGKSTALSIISGQNIPYRGKIIINGSTLGMLPQNPETLFLKSTVYDDLSDVLKGQKLSKEEEEKRMYDVLNICRLSQLIESHPYDLSGGEQQRLALAKILLLSPEIVLLDEPTKGMDEEFKEEFYDIISSLLKAGHTVIMVSHDIEFCARYADRCALFFDGNITSEDTPDKFFKGKNFYTTAACRMAGSTLPDAIIPDDIILALGGEIRKREKKDITLSPVNKKESSDKKKKKLSPLRLFFGVMFALLFIFTICYDKGPNPSTVLTVGLQLASIITLAISLGLLLPKSEEKPKEEEVSVRLTKGTILAFLFILIAVPLTIFMGIHLFYDRKYYFISLLIILETLIPFFAVFEKRKPKARELILISTLCAISVAGRTVFLPFPQFKPVIALIIITGMCFGGEMGFLVGTVTGFVSNFFFGQGPWTPWQMFGFGIIGYVSGLLFGLKIIKREKISVCILGFLLTFLYGIIVNPSTVIQFQSNVNLKMLLASYVTGFPFDVVHGVSTSFFLWFLIEPMKEKLNRIKIKYGLI